MTLSDTFTKILLVEAVFFVSTRSKNTIDTIISTNQGSENEMLSKFLVQLANKHFPSCSLLFLLDEHENGKRASTVIENTVFSAKYLTHFKNIPQPSKVEKSSNHSSLMITFPIRLSNSRRHSDQCMLTIFFINKISVHFLNQVRDVIAPSYLPITRKDMDYYIFVAESKIHDKLLRLEGFVNKIKFKIAVGINKSSLLQVTSVDFFGGPNGSPILVHISAGKLHQEESNFFPDFVWNLRGYTMQIVIPFAMALLEGNPAPWNYVKNAKRGRWKYLFEEYLMVKMNFTYRMLPSTGLDGKFGGGGTGFQLPNGTWTGIMGDLYYGRADMGLAVASTDKRIRYIGFTDTNFDAGCLTFVTGMPSQLYSTLALLWPLEYMVWTLIICSTVSALILFHFATKFLQSSHLERPSIKVNTQITLILAPFVEQDATITPDSTSLRSFIAFWSFFSLIITNLYRSKLVTLLAFPVLGNTPASFEQLAFSDFQVGFMKNGDSAHSTFSKSKDTVYVELLRRMEIIKGVNIECLEKVVSQERYGCIAYDFDVVYLMQKNFSDVKARKLKFSNARTYNVWLGLSTEAHSIFLVNFGKILGQTMPFHLSQVWDNMDMFENVRTPKLKWWAETNQTQKISQSGQGDSNNNLELKNIKGLFYIYFYCAICSMFAFFAEFFGKIHICQKRNDLLI